jgi:hypothetical protein
VDYTPFLDSGADTDAGTPGFQGDFHTLHVAASGSQTGASGRIQEGIDLTSGSTVVIEAGSYAENILANKDNLELAGAGQALVTIVPGFSGPLCGNGSSLCPEGSSIILVQANNVKIHDLTLDGNNPAITSGATPGELMWMPGTESLKISITEQASSMELKFTTRPSGTFTCVAFTPAAGALASTSTTTPSKMFREIPAGRLRL